MKPTLNETILKHQLILTEHILKITERQLNRYRQLSNILAFCLGLMCVVTFLVSLI